MRQYFLYAIGLLIPLAILGWFLFALGRAFVTLYEDWRMGKEWDELRADSEARRERKPLDNEKRLATGCEHDFESAVFGLPPNVCSKCGLERDKPLGQCDHVWRLGTGPIPASRCEKCGKAYSAAAERGGFA